MTSGVSQIFNAGSLRKSSPQASDFRREAENAPITTKLHPDKKHSFEASNSEEAAARRGGCLEGTPAAISNRQAVLAPPPRELSAEEEFAHA
jgi:hypothetical protein